MADANSFSTLLLHHDEITVLNWADFHFSLSESIKKRDRVLSFFASPGRSGSGLIYINVAVMSRADGLVFFRTERQKGDSYPSLTPEFPFFHCFEREIFEQFNLKPAGHPWLKPMRFSGEGMGKTASYPFFKMEGKEIHEVGVGPIHAGVIEPGHFRFMCYGETVHHLEIQLGYQHRALESLLLTKDPLTLAPLIETAVGDTSIGHTWAYCQAVERLCGFSSSAKVDLVRAIALEFERIAMHLSGLAGISTDIAFLPGGSTYGRLRTAIINTSMRICGSRFGRSWLRPGGVQYGIDGALNSEVASTLEDFQHDIKSINDLFISSMTVKHRLRETGVVSTELASQLGVVGLAARASGLGIDIRRNVPTSPYQSHPLQLITETVGDCWARSLVRIREIEESTKWILYVLRESPELEASVSPLKTHPEKNSVAMSVVEGWRGEVFHFLETGDDGKLFHYRIQDPSLRNWFAVAQAVRGGAISDFPICNKSFDLSYCGNDL